MKDASGTVDVTDREVCVERVRDTLAVVKQEYLEVERALKAYYHDPTAVITRTAAPPTEAVGTTTLAGEKNAKIVA